MIGLPNTMVHAARNRPRLSIALIAIISGSLAVMGGIVPASPFLRLAGWSLADGGTKIEYGLRYGRNPRHRLDIYRPPIDQSNNRKPIVIFIFGGSWRSGDKSYYRFVGDALAARGITTVIPNYRLVPEVLFPGFVEDAALAYRWVETNLLGEVGSSRRIVLVGHSAGAHTAALLALDAKYLEDAGADRNTLAAWIGLAGPYAFQATTWPTTKDIFATARDADEPRPIAHVGANEKPALLLHGLDDETVGAWNARDLATALKAAGAQVEKREYSGIDHLGVLLAIAWPFRSNAPVLDEMTAFIAQHD